MDGAPLLSGLFQRGPAGQGVAGPWPNTEDLLCARCREQGGRRHCFSAATGRCDADGGGGGWEAGAGTGREPEGEDVAWPWVWEEGGGGFSEVPCEEGPQVNL